MREEWKEIKGSPNYRISNYGRFQSRMPQRRSKKLPDWEDRALCPIPSNVSGRGNYLMINFKSGDKHVKKYIHRLVVEYFIGPIPPGMDVNHKDGNKSNNCVSNLEIMSRKENIAHAMKNGLTTQVTVVGPQKCEYKILTAATLAEAGLPDTYLSRILLISRGLIGRIRRGEDPNYEKYKELFPEKRGNLSVEEKRNFKHFLK